MDAARIETIKRQVVLAMFADDEIMDRLVLKGGSALSLAYNYPLGRTSLDVDLSMNDDFRESELPDVQNRLKHALEVALQKQGYSVLDFVFQSRPTNRKPGLPDFWGGYEIHFKVVSATKQADYEGGPQGLRMIAENVGPGSKKTFRVDISKYEFCESKIERELDGYTYYVYSPHLLVAEKLRAICQQMPDYPYTSRTRRARARDFYDIYVIVRNESTLPWTEPDFLELVRRCFEAKEVPLPLLSLIHEEDTRRFHQPDFLAVEATVSPPKGQKLRNFDFYFRFVGRFVARLKTLWEE